MAEIGLWHESPWWVELLRGEGVSFASRVAGAAELPKVLILDSAPSRSEASSIRRQVESGNALLAGAGSAGAIFPELQVRRLKLRHIEPDDSIVFRNTGLIRLDSPGCRFINSAGLTASGRLNGRLPAVLSGSLGRGTVVLLPFELPEVLSNLRGATRQFYARSPRLPYERVSAVDRGEVRRLVVNCLRFLFFRLGLPYVRLSYVPDTNISVFGFRVDTDQSDAAEIRSCLQIAEETGVAFSWFIHTGTLSEGSEILAELVSAGQDVQLHCTTHRITGRYNSDLANFRKGLEILRGAGLDPCGVASPYGIWTTQLAQIFAEIGVIYSSEFGYSWDSIPSRPLVAGKPHEVLQIPVHPVSLGNLFRARANVAAIQAYFRKQAVMQLARMEPCFFYDHPSQIMTHPELVANVLKAIASLIPSNTTLTGYARWWLCREQLRPVVNTADRTVTVDLHEPADNVSLVIEYPDRFAIVPAQTGRLKLDSLSWIPVRSIPFNPETLAVLRPSPRTMVQEAVRRLQRGYR